MKLTALRLHNVRRFAGRGVAVEGIGDGVNVLCAVNEFGKSTCFDALHALFFQPHTGTPSAVQGLRPYSGGTPLVEADITTANGAFRLTKQFYGGKRAMVRELASGRLWPHLRVTMTEMVLGLLAGTVLGLGAGILLSEWPSLHRVLRPYVLASQLVPKLALGPLLILWFGFGLTPIVVITALICFFPLFENTLTGLDQVEPAQRELFRMLGAGRVRTLLRLKLPSALPVILGAQFLLQAMNFDVLNVPNRPIHPYLRAIQEMAARADA